MTPVHERPMAVREVDTVCQPRCYRGAGMEGVSGRADPRDAALPAGRPTFALTFDTELIWGSFDHTPPARFEERYPNTRGVIRSILDLLDTYEVPATWAVVGHLFLDRCERDAAGLAHPELVRPGQSWRPGDWYADDPCSDRARDPLWYGPDVLDMIQAARVRHEIGSHSFGHALYGDPDFTREAADSDLRACVELAAARGIQLRSFVFPRNSEGWHEALRAQGFRAFRGADPDPFGGLPRPVRRAGHLAGHLLGSAPPVTRPTQKLPGLWDIRGSMLLIHRSGVRRLITRRARVRRARAGLERAQATGGVFHLWTHPFNLASDPPYLLGFLEEVLEMAVAARDRGELDIDTMGSLAERLSGTVASS